MTIKTKRMICLLIGIASILTIIGTVSYAYFSTVGEFQNQTATISTGTARATFRDNDTGITGELSFGESLTKKFTIENTGTVETTVKMYWKDLINTYTERSLTYTLSQAESEDGPYTEIVSNENVPRSSASTTEKLADSLSIPVATTYYYNLVITLNYLPDVNQDADITAKFYSTFKLEDINYKDLSLSEKTLIALGQSSNGIKTNFDIAATTDEGIFEMQDDYGTSYYYRGAVEDNYVKFGKWNSNTPDIYIGYSTTTVHAREFSTLEECQNSTYNNDCEKFSRADQEMWWRIIRINGDGSIRMIYDGIQGYANGTIDAKRYSKLYQKFNAKANDAKYLGWMYGPAGTTASTSKEEAQSNIVDSEIKKIVDAWYKENIEETGYGINVSDAIFCNDRSIPGKDITGWDYDTALGYGTQPTAYGAYARLKVTASGYNGATPQFMCPQKKDAFTVSNIAKGNGASNYPVGLITADEIVTAGGKYGINNKNFYLYHGTGALWSFSPYYMGSVSNDIPFFTLQSSLFYHYNGTGPIGCVAPVINLTPEYAKALIGTGTITDPYRAA